MASNPHIGSDFDQFLQEDGLLDDCSAVALKRVIAWQLVEAMKTQGVSKSEMASRMRTSRSQLDRVLAAGEEGGGMTLETLGRALDALGLRIRLEMQGSEKAPATNVARKGVARKAGGVTAFRDRAKDSVVQKRRA
jgi:DNA-binding phage protein